MILMAVGLVTTVNLLAQTSSPMSDKNPFSLVYANAISSNVEGQVTFIRLLIS